MNFWEEDKIYNEKTKILYRDLITSYSVGNYRSAIVELNSLVICDLIYKLKDLSDNFQDKVAFKILQDYDKARDIDEKYSSIENKFMNSIFKETSIFSPSTQNSIAYLKDLRNLCAHPSVDNDYYLYEPTKEITLGLIRELYENLFINPPIFISNIVDCIIDDLEKYKNTFEENSKYLKTFMNEKYFNKLDEVRAKQVIKTFWKFSFILDDTENLKHIKQSFVILCSIIEEYSELFFYMMKEGYFKFVSENKNQIAYLSIFFSKYPKYFDIASEDIIVKIESFVNKNKNYKFLSWYMYDSEIKFLDFISEDYYFMVSSGIYEFAYEHFSSCGYRNEFIYTTIDLFSRSECYDDSDHMYFEFIKPHLKDYKKEHFKKLFDSINDNDQIYGRNFSKSSNETIIDEYYNKFKEFPEIDDLFNIEYSEKIQKYSGDKDDSEIPF